MADDDIRPIPLPDVEPVAPKRRRRRLQGLTADERDQPFTDDPRLLDLERAAADAVPDQLTLFATSPDGAYAPLLGGLGPLTPASSLPAAHEWFVQSLKDKKRPQNTVESYSYDLVNFQKITGAIQIDAVTRSHVARFLGQANSRSTRKRHLTSLRRFFTYLIEDAKVLRSDPTDGFYPHTIGLKLPMPLFPAEQEALLTAAAADEAWSLTAVWLMMRLGLARSELLALRRDHVELTDPARPVVYVYYEEIAKRGKERKLAADAKFGRIYAEFLERRKPVDLLFPIGFQAVNGMVDRVREAAGITKEVSPQTLRHTFAVERAKDGADEDALLALLGLADDPRNRASVQRYLKLASPGL